MSLLIVEGPDGAGKTTLIESFRQSIKRYFGMFRFSRNPANPEDVIAFLNMLETRPKNLILFCDRHPLISEPIYGPILREANHAAEFSLSRHLEDLQETVQIIYCRPSKDVILRNVAETRGTQLEGVPEEIEKIIDAYDHRMRRMEEEFNIPIRYYDFRMDNAKHLAAFIEAILWG